MFYSSSDFSDWWDVDLFKCAFGNLPHESDFRHQSQGTFQDEFIGRQALCRLMGMCTADDVMAVAPNSHQNLVLDV